MLAPAAHAHEGRWSRMSISSASPCAPSPRDEVQRRNGLEVKDELIPIGEAKAMVNSRNHTVVYIPVGPLGVPLTGTFPAVPASTTAER